MAYSHNTVWFININLENDDRISVSIHSEALFTNQGTAVLKKADKAFFGTLNMDRKHKAAVLIYKDREGVKLRLAEDEENFFDLSLLPTRFL